MPLGELLSGKAKSSATRSQASKKFRTLTLSSGSLQVTTKRPELCRKAIVSETSLKIVTPARTIVTEKESSPATKSATPTKRTLRNDLFLRDRRLDNVTDTTDLRGSTSQNSPVVPEYIPTPIRKPLTTERLEPDMVSFTYWYVHQGFPVGACDLAGTRPNSFGCAIYHVRKR